MAKAREVNESPGTQGPGDTSGSPFTPSTVTSLSELCEAPSVELSDGEEYMEANQTPDYVTFQQPLKALPSWRRVEELKTQYFASVYPVTFLHLRSRQPLTGKQLFCTFSSVQFEEEYRTFRQYPSEIAFSWLSLLFAILALARRAEEAPEKMYNSDRLSLTYEKAAWDCLSIASPPFEPSTTALKALILVIYGRAHRGDNVLEVLQTAFKMASSISCHRRSPQSTTGEEDKVLWLALKTLLFMNGQLHSHSCDQASSWSMHLMASIDWEEPLEMQDRLRSLKGSFLSAMDFTMLQSQVLGVWDIIDASKRYGLLSSWGLPGIVDELSRIENECNQFDAGPSFSGSPTDLCRGRLAILRYSIRYLLQSAYLPCFESYLSGDPMPDTRSDAVKCVDSAKCALEIFCSLIEDTHYSWYLRGIGKYYAMNCAVTLWKGLESICTGEMAREAKDYLERVASFLSMTEKFGAVPSSSE
ncbi:hypothetical protein N7494_000478 [Penicillium frequentans]|uniref:Transcription factor domain-containing protein n=1 Tax=Penicillium frequentans TaxID=3151616 RepID=A0AAD6GLE2_9EURO|nr:hypothetical protein N7494_000478 [Penicillium glabrum]